jgi:hypothetical protein
MVIVIDEYGRRTTPSTGGYVTWRLRESGGTWKVIFDTGSPDPSTNE